MADLASGGALSLDPADHDVVPGLGVVHTPGHTPGHRSVVVRDGGDVLLLTGDLLHVPIQVAHPDWPSSHDRDAAMASRSRVELVGRAKRGGWRVAVSHFARPFGRVSSGSSGPHWRAT